MRVTEIFSMDNSKKGISSFGLKIIAICTMVIDHVGLTFFPGITGFRVIGRIAFPIYCFLIVEGYFHTSDIRKYMTRLLAFALLSEIPFNMMVTGDIINFRRQNVYFTLFIGLAMIYAIENTIRPFVKTLWLIVGLIAAELLNVDYTFYGIAIIYVFYSFRDNRILGCAVMGMMSLISGRIQHMAVLSVPFIMLYDGRKGPKFADKKICKYGFYLFYPVHIMIIVAVSLFLRGGLA